MNISTIAPPESKAWIFLSPRLFNDNELALINTELEGFVKSWESHGTPLKGYYEIIDNRFILLTVDESNQIATGCSIDKSVSIIKKLESLLNLNLTDRGLVAWENNSNLETASFSNIKPLVENGTLKPETIIYNNAISTFGELSNNWKIAAKDSWLKRYF